MTDSNSNETGQRPTQRRWPINGSVLLWIIAIGVIVALRWPMVKGEWYRATGSTAPPDHISWRTDYSAALAESAKTGKPVLLDFSATWCPPCQAMRHDVWPDPRVSKLVNEKYIPVAMDADAPATVGPAQRYGVSTIPRIIIVNQNGKVLRDGSYMSADEMVDFLSSLTAK